MAGEGLTFPTDQSFLSDPNVWIADTAATVHTTPHFHGAVNKRDATSEDSITVGNGSSETAAKIADIPGVVCDKYGNERHAGTLRDVTLLPTGKFNLFSLSKMMKLGWTMGGDANSIWLKSGDMKIVFDILIPTPKGALYVMYMKRTGGIKNEMASAAVDIAVEPMEFVIPQDKSREGIEDDDTSENDGEPEQLDDDDGAGAATLQEAVTRSGRTVTAPARFIEEIGATVYEIGLTMSEIRYYAAMKEFPEGEFAPGEVACGAVACVGAGLGGGFENTKELHVMKYKKAMMTKDVKNWKVAVEDEHNRFKDSEAWVAMPRDQVPKGEKIITSTWAMKKKSNGVFRARLNARGFEQIDGEHYKEDNKAAPVVNDTTFHILLILLLMAAWHAEVLDVKGAFLHGLFEDGEQIYMEIPEGFEHHYGINFVLLLLKTIYGLKQAAFAFWKELLKAFKSMEYKRSKADPCLYYQWTDLGLVLWISWVDDCLVIGCKEAVLRAKREMMSRFDCDEVGELKEYVGCKVDINRDERSITLTQPVLLQSFEDEFDLPEGAFPRTPAIAGDVLLRGEVKDHIAYVQQKKYRSGVGKLLHMMRWSRPDALNSTRELSRFMQGAVEAHLKAMLRAMKYCVGTPNRGMYLKPNRTWDGGADFEFEINGRSDSDYAKDVERRRSVSGYSVFLEGAPVVMASRMQGHVTLSVTEAELAAATQCAQDMLFVMRVMESVGLKIKKPMILEVDNKGAKDLTHNWSVGGRTRHVNVREWFLRDLKEEGVITVTWIAGDENSADMFTKNLQGPLFEKHVKVYCGDDEYMRATNSVMDEDHG